MTFDRIQQWAVENDLPAFRGRQIFGWLHARGVHDFSGMTNLSKALRAELSENVPLRTVEIVERREAADGTVKFRFRLHDESEIEGVYMPEDDIQDSPPVSGGRRTLCISTQVGCAMGCRFCATATMGLVRSLSAGEITGQLEAVACWLGKRPEEHPVTNVVFMGMGEPLANLKAVSNAVTNLLDQHGAGLSRRHVTVSTAGLVNAMDEFVSRVPARLAVSLNATSDEVRSRIMPVNKRFPLGELLDCCRHLPLKHTDRLTFEYVLLGGVNDSPEDSRRLADLLSGIRCKVNLIPYNPFPQAPFERPEPERVAEFQKILISRHYTVFVRRSRGQELQAACGQLVSGTGEEDCRCSHDDR